MVQREQPRLRRAQRECPGRRRVAAAGLPRGRRGGEAADRRVLQCVGIRERDARRARLYQQVKQTQRIAAESKEVVVARYSIDMQDLPAHVGKCLFPFPGTVENRSIEPGSGGVRRQLPGRQSRYRGAVDLPVVVTRKFVEQEQPVRVQVAGQVPGEVVADFLNGRLGVTDE